MNTTNKKSIFIFRRDLRLEDNLGLLAALKESETVLPIFIFDPNQVDITKNEYFSAPAFSFMVNSLVELDGELQKKGSKLYVFHDEPEAVITSLLREDGYSAVYCNKDYTPFSRTRDKKIADACEAAGATFFRHDDLTLSPVEDIRTGQDKLYTVFTPFMKKAATYTVATPQPNKHTNYATGECNTPTVTLQTFTPEQNEKITPILDGGRNEALAILKYHDYLDRYKDRRNTPSDESGTSKLSAHHKFGTISIRESYQVARDNAGAGSHYISELYWRDFYYYTAYHFPLVFKQSFLPWAKHLAWENNKAHFEAWKTGRTGVPIVDAAMRELNTTGWMHNRPRMIVASYLTKNLLIDWRWGEQYFASKLIDYDPAQNNGGWQWSASVGVDPRPLRIFNPYTQAANYDPEASYIKKWVPELQNVNITLLTDGKTQDFSSLAPGYPAPIIDQKETYHRAMATYKAAKETWKAEHAADAN